jgi:hypothetical protein
MRYGVIVLSKVDARVLADLRLLDALAHESVTVDALIANQSYRDKVVQLLTTIPGVDYTIAYWSGFRRRRWWITTDKAFFIAKPMRKALSVGRKLAPPDAFRQGRDHRSDSVRVRVCTGVDRQSAAGLSFADLLGASARSDCRPRSRAKEFDRASVTRWSCSPTLIQTSLP